MADPTKPSDSPSGLSPISPQIKIPPADLLRPSSSEVSPQATPPSGGPIPPGSALRPIPPNLPIKEEVRPAAAPASPPRPPIQGPQPGSDIKLKPFSIPSAPPPAQTPPKVEMPPPGGPVFKSSIRTMQEDVAALKKGQAPIGFQVEKQSEKDVTSPPMGAPGPKITVPLKPASEIKLGEFEKSRPLPSTKPLSPPPIPTPPPAGPAPKQAELSVPTGSGINKKRLILLVGYFVIIALSICNLVVWFFVLRGPSVPEVAISPTPTHTATLTPTPVSIESSFSIVGSASISLGANFTTRFDNYINKELLITLREPGLYKIFNPATTNKYTLNEFLSGLSIQAPTELSVATNGSFYLSVVNKSDNKDGYGLLIELNDPTSALMAMGNWEGIITQNLKDLFLLDPAKAATTTFLDNTYLGVAIKYKNFPDPLKTIDYAVVTAKNGKTYLVVTNSREHMYSIVDRIK